MAIGTLSYIEKIYVSILPKSTTFLNDMEVGLAMKRCKKPVITCGEFEHSVYWSRNECLFLEFTTKLLQFHQCFLLFPRLQNIKNVDPVAELCVGCRHLSSLTHMRLKRNICLLLSKNPLGMRGLKSNECFFSLCVCCFVLRPRIFCARKHFTHFVLPKTVPLPAASNMVNKVLTVAYLLLARVF